MTPWNCALREWTSNPSWPGPVVLRCRFGRLPERRGQLDGQRGCVGHGSRCQFALATAYILALPNGSLAAASGGTLAVVSYGMVAGELHHTDSMLEGVDDLTLTRFSDATQVWVGGD
jgi:hypothetical protein